MLQRPHTLAGISARFIRFCLVGGTTTSLHYAILVFLVELFAVNPTVATSIGFFCGCILSYRLNYSYTFRSDAPHTRALPRFVAVAAIGLCLNSATMYALNHVIGVYYILAQVGATGLTLIWHFTANYLWSFATHREPA